MPKRISEGPRRSLKTWPIARRIALQDLFDLGSDPDEGHTAGFRIPLPARTYELAGPEVGSVEQPPATTAADRATTRARIRTQPSEFLGSHNNRVRREAGYAFRSLQKYWCFFTRALLGVTYFGVLKYLFVVNGRLIGAKIRSRMIHQRNIPPAPAFRAGAVFDEVEAQSVATEAAGLPLPLAGGVGVRAAPQMPLHRPLRDPSPQPPDGGEREQTVLVVGSS